MIARDEAHCISRCLESVGPLVDEMIVVDTGSTDNTAELARKAGARVHSFSWCDDFSAARNAALEFASAEWNLVLDADEWIEGQTTELAKTLVEPADFIGLLPVASEFDLQGQAEVAISWMPRLLPGGVRYRGEVHEQPVTDLPRRHLAVKIRHDGYRLAMLEQKKGRNRGLLLKMLENAPEDSYLHYQLGRDYEIYGEFEDAVSAYTSALERSSMHDRFRHDLVVRTLYSLKRLQRHEQAMQFAEQEMPNWSHSPDFYFSLGDLLLDYATSRPEQAAGLLPMIEASWLKCLEIGDQPLLEGSVRGRGSFLAAHNLGVVYEQIGDTDKAVHYRAMADQARSRAT
jgi:glycosyltransferase involved in cell wall biosynthesis